MLEWACFEEVSSLSAARSNQLPKLLKDKVSQNATSWNLAKLRQVHTPTTTTWLQRTQTQERREWVSEKPGWWQPGSKVAKKLDQPSMVICIPVNIISSTQPKWRHTAHLSPTTMKEAHIMTGRKANEMVTKRIGWYAWRLAVQEKNKQVSCSHNGQIWSWNYLSGQSSVLWLSNMSIRRKDAKHTTPQNTVLT